MRPENSIVVSLNAARDLQSEGWPQHEDANYFYWIQSQEGEWIVLDRVKVLVSRVDNEVFHGFAAPTAEEILRRLPSRAPASTSMFERLRIECTNMGFVIGYASPSHKFRNEEWFEADTLANAAAAMWCYIKENNFLPKI